jgi:PKD repeat protein
LHFIPSVNQAGYHYRWLFGDGNISTITTPSHTYQGDGTYSVKLTIRDSIQNCIDTARQNISIASGDTCTAFYTYTLDLLGGATFTASSNMAVQSQLWTIYRYSTGDSVLIQANDPAYQFPDTGYYQVCVYLTTNTGCNSSYCENIYVSTIAGTYANTVQSYPNPVNQGNVTMNVNLARSGHIDIRVIDINGHTAFQTRMHGREGVNQVRIPVDRLNKGQYFVEICYGYKLLRSIFQKQ